MWNDEELGFVSGFTRDLLKALQALGRGLATDVFAWAEPRTKRNYRGLNIAFVGDAQKVGLLFGAIGERGGLRGDFVTNMLGPLGFDPRSFRSNDEVNLPDFLSRGGNIIDDWMKKHGVEFPFDESSWRFIPSPGFPWPYSNESQQLYDEAFGGFSYWSAKNGEQVAPRRPGWLIDVMYRGSGENAEVLHRGVDPCIVFPPDATIDVDHGVMGEFPNGQAMMVAHSMELADRGAFALQHRQLDTAIEGIKRCGGLLFPSLSVGPVPASNFGPVSLIGRLGLVLNSLRPYKKPRKILSWVYDTDAWTGGTGDFMNAIAVKLFDEFHGHESYEYNEYGAAIWALGPPRPAPGGADPGKLSLETTKALGAAILRRMRPFERDLSESEFKALTESLAGTGRQYGYCEAKVREVVRLDEFPYMVAPESMRATVKTFVSGVGYRGKVLFVKWDIPDRDSGDREYALYEWAWIVADVVRSLEPIHRIRT